MFFNPRLQCANGLPYVHFTTVTGLFLPILPVHSPSTRGTANRNGVSSSTVTATSLQTPSLQNFNIHKRLGAWAPTYVSTEQHLHGDNYNRGSASGRGPRPTALKTQEKNDRERNMLITGKSLRVHNSRVVDSRQNLDVNQSN